MEPAPQQHTLGVTVYVTKDLIPANLDFVSGSLIVIRTGSTSGFQLGPSCDGRHDNGEGANYYLGLTMQQ
jgi:hypothetical protein